MNRHLLLILFLLLLSPTVSAQRIHAFISSGVIAGQIEGDELKGFNHFGYSGGVGALASISHTNRWGMSIEAAFSQRGAYNNSGDPYSINLNLNYIDIPLLIHYQDPYGGMLFGLGIEYSRLVQQPHSTMKYNPAYFVPDTADMHFLGNDFSVVADARFVIWRGLQFNLRWQHSLFPIKKEWQFSEYLNNGLTIKTYTNNCYNHAISIRLLWQF